MGAKVRDRKSAVRLPPGPDSKGETGLPPRADLRQGRVRPCPSGERPGPSIYEAASGIGARRLQHVWLALWRHDWILFRRNGVPTATPATMAQACNSGQLWSGSRALQKRCPLERGCAVLTKPMTVAQDASSAVRTFRDIARTIRVSGLGRRWTRWPHCGPTVVGVQADRRLISGF